MKIKLFTHTDLDGIGCAVLAYLAFGKENVDVEYCDYKNVDEKVREFYLHNDTAYDAIYITDISLKEETAGDIDRWIDIDKVELLDHHATALWMNKYDWCDVKVEVYGIKTSGTQQFYDRLMCCEYLDCNDSNLKHIRRFVEIVRDYDTWRWKEELGEAGLVCKQLNDLFHIYGRYVFIDWVIDKIKLPSHLFDFPAFDGADKLLLEQKQKDIDTYIDIKNKQLNICIDKFGHLYGVVFAERYFSELGNRLSELYPDLEYIAMIDICSGTVSYRTVHEGIDLGGEIAHSFGGGGHKKAAGSTFDKNDVQIAVMEKIFATVE